MVGVGLDVGEVAKEGVPDSVPIVGETRGVKEKVE